MLMWFLRSYLGASSLGPAVDDHAGLAGHRHRPPSAPRHPGAHRLHHPAPHLLGGPGAHPPPAGGLQRKQPCGSHRGPVIEFLFVCSFFTNVVIPSVVDKITPSKTETLSRLYSIEVNAMSKTCWF